MSRKLTYGIAVYVAAIVTGSAVAHYLNSRADEATDVAEPVQEPVQERVFVCTDKYGTSQERFGVRTATLYDQVWQVLFDNGQTGTYLQMHGEWCYVLPVEVKEEEK